MTGTPNYESFVASKLFKPMPTGLSVVPRLHGSLFPHQRDLVGWALKRGRAAIFAATGLGKTRIEVEWSRHCPKRVLILAPLAVAQQTVREADEMGITVAYARDGSEHPDVGIVITNYERLHRFDPDRFGGIVIDESSIIKHHDAKTLASLMAFSKHMPWRLACTATPAPNDYAELGTHAEFLGICTRSEMLAEYFCHDGGDTSVWRLKGHARNLFWRWVASWGALLRKPSELGHDDAGYDLPPLTVTPHVIAGDMAEARASGFLFPIEAKTLSERRGARRSSISSRVEACAATVALEPGEQWIVWVDLNAESSAIAKAIPGAVEIQGSNTPEEKENAMLDFAEGRLRVLVSKPSICGFGMNFQRAARMAFVGVTDSWEAYYQAIRRVWRFGQTRGVHVHVFYAETEGAVVENLRRKEESAARMSDELSSETRETMRHEVLGSTRETNEYRSPEMTVPTWLIEENAS